MPRTIMLCSAQQKDQSSSIIDTGIHFLQLPLRILQICRSMLRLMGETVLLSSGTRHWRTTGLKWIAIKIRCLYGILRIDDHTYRQFNKHMVGRSTAKLHALLV